MVVSSMRLLCEFGVLLNPEIFFFSFLKRRAQDRRKISSSNIVFLYHRQRASPCGSSPHSSMHLRPYFYFFDWFGDGFEKDAACVQICSREHSLTSADHFMESSLHGCSVRLCSPLTWTVWVHAVIFHDRKLNLAYLAYYIRNLSYLVYHVFVVFHEVL